MLDDAPWTWGSTGGWCADMPEFFQGMPSGVYDNIYDDLDDSPVSWHITEVGLGSRNLHAQPRLMSRTHPGNALRVVYYLACENSRTHPR